MTEVQIVTIQPEHAAPLRRLQLICFPNIPPDELYSEKELLEVCEVFPDGTFVALAGETVVGLGSGVYTDFDPEHPQHTLLEIFARGHNPASLWYYGLDISVHPDYRGYGIGRRLYDARKAVVQRDNKRGIVAGGLVPGFARHKQSMSLEEYVAKVSAGELYDPTLTFQLRNGFEVRGILENYASLKVSDRRATLIIWENPKYIP
ncbi:MAG: GNAT family N-acetyltransferase [Anaerolineae bacterium]|nr:GNAT family N-acetyltransferase [Anaerolineae bacterium]